MKEPCVRQKGLSQRTVSGQVRAEELDKKIDLSHSVKRLSRSSGVLLHNAVTLGNHASIV